ncbi:phosphatidylserine decarboxylase [Psychroserpens algicola]|uniref:Phosphatidylserine decarboxylase n=1 Tax=Psychroserpens algicola TaxID=1719034 RepID=A0ABT0H6J2_9FLAO|nr:phosphatidylserine decarboxylase [Psychroserpens algicola]MCK8479999.1 phosphatidylserine decarboxylase [Psychroserpens algicola]
MKHSNPKWPKTTTSYKALKSQIKNDKNFRIALQTSLMIAKKRAWNELHPDLYHALDNVFDGNGWPTTPDAYLDYVEHYLVLIPNEIDDPIYPDAWSSDDTQNGHNQKVYDLLCQFYFLVDQQLPSMNIILQSYKKGDFIFADWLRDFAIDWGLFLDTKESLPLSAMTSFIIDPMYNIPLYSENSKKWNTFNEFFYREFNGANKKGHTPLRPIAEPDNNNVITSPADCTYKMMYPIDDHGNVLGLNGQPTSMTLKGTHTVNSINELLQDDELAEAFKGGTFVHYFLSPFDYHRFHSPVNGKVKECKAVRGKVFLDVTLNSDGEFHAPDSSEGGYEFQQARGVFVVDAGETVGLIAAVPIGMAQVSGVDMYTKLKGKQIKKGDEFGKFMFGGSDTILLFQKNPDLYLWKNDPAHNPIHFQFGQVCAYWNVKN